MVSGLLPDLVCSPMYLPTCTWTLDFSVSGPGPKPEAVSDPLCAEPQITPLPAISMRFL